MAEWRERANEPDTMINRDDQDGGVANAMNEPSDRMIDGACIHSTPRQMTKRDRECAWVWSSQRDLGLDAGAQDDVDAAVGLDDAADLTNLQCGNRILEGYHGDENKMDQRT